LAVQVTILLKAVKIISGISPMNSRTFFHFFYRPFELFPEQHLRNIALCQLRNIAKLEHGSAFRVYVLSQAFSDFGKRSQGEEG